MLRCLFDVASIGGSEKRIAWGNWGEAMMLELASKHARTGKRVQIRQAVRIARQQQFALKVGRGQEPPARSRQPTQVRVPGEHVPRATDAAERDHWLLRSPNRPHVWGVEREAGRVPQGHLCV